MGAGFGESEQFVVDSGIREIEAGHPAHNRLSILPSLLKTSFQMVMSRRRERRKGPVINTRRVKAVSLSRPGWVARVVCWIP